MTNTRIRALQAPSLSQNCVIAAAESLIRRYVQIVGPDRLHRIGISFDDVYEQVIYPEYGIELIEDFELECDSKGTKPLGRFDVVSNRAYIGIPISDPRRVFTCWHEVGGHGVLQVRGFVSKSNMDRRGRSRSLT